MGLNTRRYRESNIAAEPDSFRVLGSHEVQQIEEALGQLEGEGEVCLVLRNGRLRFIEVVRSFSVISEEEAPAG